MGILLIVLLVLSIVGLALCIFKVPVDQRVINIIVFCILISLLFLIYNKGLLSFKL